MNPQPQGPERSPAEQHERSARYVLGVLVIVYILNFLDRQILSILAERIKADLGVSDAQMGYLYGTAFAVFFALFGIPLGRLADVWSRTRLIAWGLAAWSTMTTLSGFARNFTHLALARVGVGIGEASASPAAYSLLADYFPKARRATALAIYSSGIYLGSGLGLGIGGLIVDRWDLAWPGGTAPLGLKGWQVAFLAVGLPGVLLALWVRTLREPVRGALDGHPTPVEPHPFRAFLRELGAVIPPFTVWTLLSLAGATDSRSDSRKVVVAKNLFAAAFLAGLATLLTRALGNPAQWISLSVGIYAAVSWAQSLALRDRPSYTLIFTSRSLIAANLAFALLAFTSYAYGFWLAPHLIRTYGTSLGNIGWTLGGLYAACGWLGVTLGGMLADRLQKRSPYGRLQVAMISAVLSVPFAIALLHAPDLRTTYLLCIPLFLCNSLWLGPGASVVQEMVLPRMRAIASANYLLIVTFIGLALGPYTAGRLSVALGGLKPALLWVLCANALSLVCALYSARYVERDEATKTERARAAGEA